MKVAIYTLTSPLHDQRAIEAGAKQFIDEIEAHVRRIAANVYGSADFELDYRKDDFSQFGSADWFDVIYVRTGGTEGLFKKLYPTLHRKARVLTPIRLLTSGKSNSLAASMEILSYLNQQGGRGEIIHGTTEYIAERLVMFARVENARHSLQGQTIGVIGQPSDWLISSEVRPSLVEQKLGVKMVDISIKELVEEINKHDYPGEVLARINPCQSEYLQGALDIYGALKRIIAKYHLTALTLRCFDLLTAVKNTGCLALALLNEEGIPSSCEGDVPTLLTMMVAYALTGSTGFQANPARIDPETGEMVFAHCTLPLNMVKEYTYNTHFESGIGLAIKGELPTGDATIVKLSGNLSRGYVRDVELLRNLSETNLCRTQIVLRAPGVEEYFMHNPISNHHVILLGSQKKIFSAFLQQVGIQEIN